MIGLCSRYFISDIPSTPGSQILHPGHRLAGKSGIPSWRVSVLLGLLLHLGLQKYIAICFPRPRRHLTTPSQTHILSIFTGHYICSKTTASLALCGPPSARRRRWRGTASGAFTSCTSCATPTHMLPVWSSTTTATFVRSRTEQGRVGYLCLCSHNILTALLPPISGGVTLLMVCLQIFVSDHDTEKQGQYSYCSLQPRDSTNPIVMYEYGFGMSQVLVALFSIVYASKRLQRGGTEASRRLFYTHLAYATVFIVLWTAEVSLQRWM